MNILFLSKLSGKKGCGPYYSIPNQVAAQRKVDNVLWFNINDVQSDDWQKWADVKTCREYPVVSLHSLPEPFCHPDLVVVEEQYEFFNEKIMREVQKEGIPYIIVPRCSLTKTAQQRKHYKKVVGNFLYFNRFIKNAAGIQYLTEHEKADSGDCWNTNGFVIPNGIEMPDIKKKFNSDKIECVFIGRIDIYHKGLDLLLNACGEVANILREAKVHISIYGTGERKDVDFVKSQIASRGIVDIVSYHGPVYGEDKQAVLQNCDIFILTSRFEGLPMGILEALSFGMPVLVTQGTSMCDVVNKYGAGWTTDTALSGICLALTQLIREKEKLEEISQKSIQLAKEYSWPKIAGISHDIYKGIIETWSKRN